MTTPTQPLSDRGEGHTELPTLGAHRCEICGTSWTGDIETCPTCQDAAREKVKAYPPKFCIHYRNPMQSDGCGAGVPFERIRPLTFSQRPCYLNDQSQSKPSAHPCEHLRLPSAAEIAEFERETEEEIQNFETVLRIVNPWRKQHARTDHHEVIACPKCNGKLHLSINSYNSHVWGKCDTDGCLEWME